jgi:hypothetical protein
VSFFDFCAGFEGAGDFRLRIRSDWGTADRGNQNRNNEGGRVGHIERDIVKGGPAHLVSSNDLSLGKARLPT